MRQVEIVVDVHERRSRVPAELIRLGVAVVMRSLTVGDYAVGAGTVVERKTTVDLVLSLRSGRLWRQIGSLRRRSHFPVLLVEGAPPHVVLGGEAGRGLVLAIADQGIAVLSSSDPEDSARWLAALACRRQTRVPRDRPPFTYRSRLPSERPGEALLCSVPGISVHHARALLDAFGSVRGVLDAGSENWLSVRGIGPTRAAALARSLGDEHS